MTNASNTIKDVIAGTTLNLIKEDAATTVNLTVGRDLDTIKKTIQDYVGKYNDLMSYINTQFSYDTEKKTTGGVLFGDGTLSSAKSDISALTTQTIWGVNSNFSIMGMIGINLDNNQLLTIDDAILTGYLQTNFNDVKALFTAQGTTASTDLAYIASTKDSKAGDYTVHIDQRRHTGHGDGQRRPLRRRCDGHPDRNPGQRDGNHCHHRRHDHSRYCECHKYGIQRRLYANALRQPAVETGRQRYGNHGGNRLGQYLRHDTAKR